MKDYMYLFRGGDDPSWEQSPHEMQEHMQKWISWTEKLEKTGNYVDGFPLHNHGKVVRKAGKLISDGPFIEGKEFVGGYLIIKAKDMDHAVELSRECPIFKNDGIVEVREILPM